MDDLPAWALRIITAAPLGSVWCLAILHARPIAPLPIACSGRAGGSASAGKGTGAPRTGQPSSFVRVNAR